MKLSQKEKDKYHTISLICGTELIYKAETASETWKTTLCLPKGKGGGGGINQEFGFSIYKLFNTIYKIDKQQTPTVQLNICNVHSKSIPRIYRENINRQTKRQLNTK